MPDWTSLKIYSYGRRSINRPYCHVTARAIGQNPLGFDTRPVA